MALVEYSWPALLRWPARASSAATSRNDRWPPAARALIVI
jgi:hypothetical protein